MPAHSTTLQLMVGEVMSRRPRVTRDEVVQDINAAIRLAIGQRPFWSDLLTRGVIPIPDAFADGTASVSPGSNQVTGASTAWPVADVFNGSLAEKVQAYGGDFVEVKPGPSMAGLNVGTMVYFGEPFAEAAAIVEVTRESFFCRLQNSHDAGAALTVSSLAGRQFRISTGTPIFTVRAVIDPETLLLDNPWGAGALTGQSYNIYAAYVSVDPDFREFIAVKDELTGWPIKINVPIQLVDFQDPQRSSSGDPMWVVDHSPNEAGVMQYEIYPHQFSARQLSVLYAKGWPQLKRDNDRPPWFMDPTIFMAAAKAKALMTKKPVNINGKLQDPYYDPQAADMYAREAMGALQAAINADESRALRALDANWAALGMPGNANFWQSHDPDINAWNF